MHRLMPAGFKICIVIATAVDDFIFLINFIPVILLNTPVIPLQGASCPIFPQVELLDRHLDQMNYSFL